MLCIAGASACTPAVPPAPSGQDRTVDTRQDTLVVTVLAPTTAQFPDLEADVLCSRTRARTGLAVLSWTGESALGAQPMRLDVAVEKSGFERGEFVSADPAVPGAPFRPATARVLAAAKARAFDIRIAAAEDARFTTATRPPSRSIVVEGLEPGVTYSLRLAVRTERGWSPAPTIRVQGPTCPADMERP
jgi:hypothetical protein